MDALVLAAGFGTRLRDVAGSKPLALINGVSLVEIAIRQLVRAGADRVVVVTGYRAEEVERELRAIADRTAIAVSARRLSDWSRPNGYSVLAGSTVIEGDYLLVMADHLLTDAILQPLARQGHANAGLTLAVDRKVSCDLIDPEDATWVRTDAAGRISAIGKDLVEFDAVDCGAFLATPELASAIEAAIASGRPGSLSDGVQRLADLGRAATFDVGDAWWLDVDDPRAHALAAASAAVRFPHLFGPAGPAKAAA